MTIPTEPIGSIPRPGYLMEAMSAHGAGRLDDAGLAQAMDRAVAHLGADGLGATDDCGFSPFGDDVSTARNTAFAKIRARVEGARLAEERLS